MAEDGEERKVETTEDGTGRPAGPESDPTMKVMATLTGKLAELVKVERFAEPKTVQAVAAVSFKGDTVYCTDDSGTKFAEAAGKSLAVSIGCILVKKLSTPEGILELMGEKAD